ncbi:HHL125Cp [Eremothecium sinecaudum]|uniref:HHL125Cp n=1 Tax=Eremothecium sinecaudum TaxID=45286 RepID=A0A0X8HWA0_9SACH|nr:HHL125Cp [Eremothecium sinecaudum]AMD22645.1 HHL125Cp [Eremothecium sinecaudum]
MSFEQEYNKLVSRRDELQKQEITLRREFTILLRKIASITAVLDTLEDEHNWETKNLLDRTITKVPELRAIAESLEALDELPPEQVEIPEKLMHSYELFKNTPLLYKDSPNLV